jgi:hypothetical protein
LAAVVFETRAWLEWVSLTSIPLYRLDEDDRPIGVASGCLLRFGERKLILSVAHATRQGRWAAELRFDSERDGTDIHFFGDQWGASHLDQSTAMRDDLDFSLTEVPMDFHPTMQERSPNGEVIREQFRHTFESTLQDLPSRDEVYAFSGRVRPAQLDARNYWAEPTVYPGLRFEHTAGLYHVFSLPVPHPGHEAFQGCSGAPVVDRQRRVVALVCSGDIPSNTISAVSLRHLAQAIQDYMRGGVRA